MEETWLHCFPSESKRPSSEWTARGEPTPNRAKMQQSADKAMAPIFWDAYSIIFIDYLEKRKVISSDYYIAFLKDEWPHLKKKKALFHQDTN